MVNLGYFHARHAAVIYNPVARTLSRNRHLLQRTIQLLAEQGIEASLVETTAPGTAGLQAKRQIEAGCDLIVAAGGDGTINEIANGMLHSGVPLAILPGGTANVLAREMKLPIRLDSAAAQISKLKPVSVAAGRLEFGDEQERVFLCMTGIGLDAEIVSHLNLDLKAATGKFAYYCAGFAQVLRPLREFDVFVDGRQYQASFALVSRVRNYGGDLEIARGASLLKDEFEIVLFRGTASVRYLQYLIGVALKCVERVEGCTVLRGRSVTCLPHGARNICFQMDGELAGSIPLSIDIVPEALTLLVPERYLSREQSLVALPACA